MASKSIGFTFDDDDVDLEYNDSMHSTSGSRRSSRLSASASTETVTNAEAKKPIGSMKILLLKTSTGTVTREERCRLKALTSKVNKLKEGIEKLGMKSNTG
jgi:hypothetical protein